MGVGEAVGVGVGSGVGVGVGSGVAVGSGVGHRTGGASLPDGDGSSNEGITPLSSGVGSGRQVGDGDGEEQPAPSNRGPHVAPYGRKPVLKK